MQAEENGEVFVKMEEQGENMVKAEQNVEFPTPGENDEDHLIIDESEYNDDNGNMHMNGMVGMDFEDNYSELKEDTSSSDETVEHTDDNVAEYTRYDSGINQNGLKRSYNDLMSNDERVI